MDRASAGLRQLILVKITRSSQAEDWHEGFWTVRPPSMLAYRVTIRRLAGHLLVMWFFALGAGFAHTCALDSRVAPSEDAEVGLHGHAPSGDAGETTCFRLSDDAKAIASHLQPGGDPLNTPLPVLMATLRAGGEPLVAASTSARADWHTHRQRLPISIAYLRLAL